MPTLARQRDHPGRPHTRSLQSPGRHADGVKRGQGGGLPGLRLQVTRGTQNALDGTPIGELLFILGRQSSSMLGGWNGGTAFSHSYWWLGTGHTLLLGGQVNSRGALPGTGASAALLRATARELGGA